MTTSNETDGLLDEDSVHAADTASMHRIGRQADTSHQIEALDLAEATSRCVE